MTDFIKEAAHVKPSANQLRLLRETPFYAFVHFSPNTYTNLEWGDGSESPSVFNPVELDCDSWCDAFVSAGMKGVILTAKHHDGFCLWQSEYTEHCMKNSPYKNGNGDIVKELSDACRRHGLKFGFYLSPWDRNTKYYGSDEYNDYYCNQLTELLTKYGEIFHVWFDGACGEGPNGKKQVYDFDRFIGLIEKYQPNATYFNDAGIVRWCGNESGSSRVAEWAVVPKELCFLNKNVQTSPGPLAAGGSLEYMYNMDDNIGSLSNIIYSDGLVFSPAEVDMSIRPGWFYHSNEEPHSLERLFDTYIRSVGGNTTFNLNVPPMPNGMLDQRDVTRLNELGNLIRTSFEVNLAESAQICITPYNDSETQRVIDISFSKPEVIKYIELQEKIEEGQRVESFIVMYENENGVYQKFAESTTVGARRILPVSLNKATESIRIIITSSRDEPELEKIAVY